MQNIVTLRAEDMSVLLLHYGVTSGVALVPQPTGMYWFESLFQNKGSADEKGRLPSAWSSLSWLTSSDFAKTNPS